MMAGAQSSQEERIERLKALLTGQSASGRTRAAVASGEYGSLLFGVALHGAEARGSRALTDLERLLVDALATVVDAEELTQWGSAYRETVRTADPARLTVPAVIAERPVASGFAIADLESELPHLAKAALAAPNVSLVSLEDLAAGRTTESAAFVRAMGERGFAVTGVARYPEEEGAPRAAAAPEAAESWRVKMEMDSFHVVREVGDQWGGKDEIYFTSAAGVGGDDGGQTFRSQEFGGVKKGDTRTFDTGKREFLNKPTSSGFVIASVQVWEADQSRSEWYSKLQLALNIAVEEIDKALEHPMMIILDPIPMEVSLAYEIAKVFISLMDALRNNDDLSCSRTFVLSRDDLAVMYHRPVEWNFNGDGHHRLKVHYTGERPVYPEGSIELIVRNHGLTPGAAGPWSAPIPLRWKTRATPAIADYRDALYTVFARSTDNKLMWSRHDGKAWATPRPIGTAASNQPPALAVHQNNLHLLYTGGDGRVYHGWFNGQQWSATRQAGNWTSALGPALAALDNKLWAARTDNQRVHVASHVSDHTWSASETVGNSRKPDARALSGPALNHMGGALGVDVRGDDEMHFWTQNSPGAVYPWDLSTGLGFRSLHAPTVHHATNYEWFAHSSISSRALLSWRDLRTNRRVWSDPEEITDALAAPVFTTHQRRLYGIYHA
ncbi:hypothetical protein [Streptomyces anulatus]|uniref:hypothetical protein n=1 Tax=Streptomyces anulatus TaxID=1892 RepID=UPI0038697608|nr:hypothetical protein OG865_03915 [Streptomyces anulatus]